MMYPFLYKVNYWDGLKDNYSKVCGVTFAENYAGAMKNIESYYGDTITEIESLICLEESKILEIPQTMYKILQNNYSDFSFCEEDK